MGLLSRKPASPETQLAAFRKRKTELDERLAAAQQHAASAGELRCELLTRGELEDPKLERAEVACLAAQGRVLGIEDAMRHLGAQILDVEQAIAAAGAKQERERVAAEMESRAARLERAANDLDKAARDFDLARARLVDFCFADASPADVFQTNPAGGIVGAAGRLAGCLPRLDVHDAMGLPHSARDAAAPLAGQLRR